MEKSISATIMFVDILSQLKNKSNANKHLEFKRIRKLVFEPFKLWSNHYSSCQPTYTITQKNKIWI